MGVYIPLPVLELTVLRRYRLPLSSQRCVLGVKVCFGVFQHTPQFPVEKRMKLPLELSIITPLLTQGEFSLCSLCNYLKVKGSEIVHSKLRWLGR